MADVAKPFTTTQRRFRTGMSVSREDDLSPHTFDGLQAAGYIEDTSVEAKPAPLARKFPRKGR